MQRANARRQARERRREELRLRRAGIVATAVLGAAAFAPVAAQAATFQVTTTADSGAGSLRDAITQANAAAGDDTITFDPSVTGIIRLTSGPLAITASPASDALTITGPGATRLTISGDKDSSGTPNAGDSRIFDITTVGAVSISGLTLTNGYDASGGVGGGAINDRGFAPLTLTDSVVSNSLSDNSNGGGGIYVPFSGPGGQESLSLVRTTMTGNTASAGPGGGVRFGAGKYSSLVGLTITDSAISGNTATSGGGIASQGPLSISGTTVSGNTVTGSGVGGGIDAIAKYSGLISDSTISGNTAHAGGGLELAAPFITSGALTVRDTTISGNQATYGAGAELAYIGTGTRVVFDRTAISGNTGGASSFGGGVLLDKQIIGDLKLQDSTVSGNTATSGGGVSIGSDCGCPVLTKYSGSSPRATGSISFDNSTIAANTATDHGGGIYLSEYDTASSPSTKKSASASLRSTIVGDNTAGGVAQDLDRIDTSPTGGFGGSFSLVEAPGDAPLSLTAGITGKDAGLSALADNGGKTKTQMIAGTSPAIDQGRAFDELTVDQRGRPRTYDSGLDNASGGDGTDIGAVELNKDQVVLPPGPPPPPPPPPPPTPAFSALLRGVPLGGTSTPLLIAGTTPVACNATVETISSCVIEVRATNATSTRATVPAGTLLAYGAAATSIGTAHLQTGVRLTRAGRAVLARRPVGLDATATVFGGAKDPFTKTGTVRLLGVPWFTLRIEGRDPALARGVLAQLGRIAGLISGARSATCTAYTDRGRGDRALTRAQARAACAELAARGFAGTTTSVGGGHSNPIAGVSRAANRRLVIRIRF